jgi:hypothetical protein
MMELCILELGVMHRKLKPGDLVKDGHGRQSN